VDVGDPPDALGRRASHEAAKLIVVGSRGRGPLSAVLLGSVSRSLVAAAPVPLVVVPPTARHPRLGDAALRLDRAA
jgi:nucleotide-binding universal stress UspA family protein